MITDTINESRTMLNLLPYSSRGVFDLKILKSIKRPNIINREALTKAFESPIKRLPKSNVNHLLIMDQAVSKSTALKKTHAIKTTIKV